MSVDTCAYIKAKIEDATKLVSLINNDANNKVTDSDGYKYAHVALRTNNDVYTVTILEHLESDEKDGSYDPIIIGKGFRTYLSMSCTKESVNILKSIVSYYGGVMVDNDCETQYYEVPKSRKNVIRLYFKSFG